MKKIFLNNEIIFDWGLGVEDEIKQSFISSNKIIFIAHEITF